MTTTLRIETLEGDDFLQHDDDHDLMHLYVDTLDEVCDEEEVRRLSDFFDAGGGPGPEGDSDDEEPDDDGDGRSVADMAWYEAGEGRTTLQTLRERLAGSELPGVDADDREALLEELDHCLRVVEPLVQPGGEFHLAVVA